MDCCTWLCFLFLYPSARSSTTTMTMVIDNKNGDAGSPSARTSKKTFTDDLYSTFSSPLAWILVLALVITWSCVFVIMFDLTDYKTISGMEKCFCCSVGGFTSCHLLASQVQIQGCVHWTRAAGSVSVGYNMFCVRLSHSNHQYVSCFVYSPALLSVFAL